MDSVSEHRIADVPEAKPAGNSLGVTAAPAPPRRFQLPRRPIRLWVLLAVVLAFASFITWSRVFSSVTVALAPVQRDVRLDVFGLGTIGARVQSSVGFKVAGVLLALDADQGDRVKAGQVLARLDARDVEAQLAVAKANVAQAIANIEKAKAEAVSAAATFANAKAMSARRASLAKRGYASVEEAQTNEASARVAEANLRATQVGVTVAEAALKSVEAQEAFEEASLSNYTLRAPYDAWVVARNLELGSMPNPGQPVFTLVEADTVWAVAYVDERLAGRLHVGQPAEITLRSDPSVRLPGKVARIEIASDAVNEERLVDVAFDRIPANIHLAEQAEVYITTGELAQAALVPETAVADLSGNKGTAWLLENKRLARASLTFGPQLLDGRLPVLSGIPDGAFIVLPQPGLRVGEAARAGPAAAP